MPAQTRKHVASLAPDGSSKFAAGWRDSVFIEYYFNDNNAKCGGYNTEDIHNNFIGIRHMEGSEFGDTSYTEYQSGSLGKQSIGFGATDVDFIEYFNLTADNWQMDNLWKKGATPAAPAGPVQAKLHDKLHKWFNCRNDCP